MTELLMKTPVTDHVPRDTTGDIYVWKEGNVMTVQHDETLPMVFRKFAVEGFLSAPVLNDDFTFKGFVDMLDLVKYTTSLFWGETSAAWVSFWSKQNSFATATVDDAMDKTTRWSPTPLNIVHHNFSSQYALETMVRTGAHRVAVVNDLNRIVGIITQSMLISMIRQNMYLLPKLRKTPVEKFQGLASPVISVIDTDIAINAFNRMISENISGVAIINGDGVLTGSLSVRDLRGVGTDGEFFSRLFKTVKDFKTLARQEYPFLAPRTHYSRKLTPVKGLYCTPDSTFEEVVNLMCDGNVHRIFVCSTESSRLKEPVPVQVITQRDVLKQILLQLN